MENWVSAWRCVPVDYGYEIGCFENVTQAAVFRNNLAGSGVRVRLCNLGGDAPMEITRASLWLRSRVSGVRSPEYRLTLGDSAVLTVAAGAAPWSDPVDCAVTAEDDFVLKLYFGKRTPLRCVCLTWAAQSWHSVQLRGDYGETEALGFTVKRELVPGLAEDPYPNTYVAGVCDIQVKAAGTPRIVSLFGDSITHMSYMSDSLIELLYGKYPGRCAVLNGGISGNRVQKGHPVIPPMPGQGRQFGAAGRDRFAADVLDGAPDVVVLFEGVNDCSHSIVFGEPDVPAAADIYGALADVAGQAKAAGCAVLVCTVTPFGGFGMPWRAQAEALRQGLNALLRARCPGDRLVDLDAALRDPERPDVMQAGMHLGDGVHPGWPGGRKLAGVLARALEEFLK